MRSLGAPGGQRLAVVATVALLGSGACAAADTARDSAHAVNASDPAIRTAGDSAAPAAGAAWYDRSRSIDLTGDGRPDTVRLTARGARPDSMQVRMVFVVDGEEKHREGWGSSYELALANPALRTGPQAEVLLRARLDTVLASVVVEPLEGATPGLMAEDSAILANVSPWPTERVVFAYGYESQSNLFWDAPRDRFVRLWSCC